MKKIWEITKIPDTKKNSPVYNLITAQVKKGTIYNLRPFNFPRAPNDCISSRLSFVKGTTEAFRSAVEAFEERKDHRDRGPWTFRLLSDRQLLLAGSHAKFTSIQYWKITNNACHS